MCRRPRQLPAPSSQRLGTFGAAEPGHRFPCEDAAQISATQVPLAASPPSDPYSNVCHSPRPAPSQPGGNAPANGIATGPVGGVMHEVAMKIAAQAGGSGVIIVCSANFLGYG